MPNEISRRSFVGVVVVAVAFVRSIPSILASPAATVPEVLAPSTGWVFTPTNLNLERVVIQFVNGKGQVMVNQDTDFFVMLGDSVRVARPLKLALDGREMEAPADWYPVFRVAEAPARPGVEKFGADAEPVQEWPDDDFLFGGDVDDDD